MDYCLVSPHGKEALRYALDLCDAKEGKGPLAFSVLAEAYAAADRLIETASGARNAIEAAERTGRHDLANAAGKQLRQYERRKASGGDIFDRFHGEPNGNGKTATC